MTYTAWVTEHYIRGRVVATGVSREEAIAAVVAAAREAGAKSYTPPYTAGSRTAQDRDGCTIVWDASPLPGPYPMGLIEAGAGAEREAPKARQPPPPPPTPKKMPPPPPPPPVRK